MRFLHSVVVLETSHIPLDDRLAVANRFKVFEGGNESHRASAV